jgi:C_GCAxxG_C_C family probable redox protein
MPKMADYNAANYFGSEYNCAQCIMKAVDESYNLNISDDVYSALSNLGKGLGIGSVCGALLAGMMVFGIIANERTAKAMRIRLFYDFTSLYSEIHCAKLIRTTHETDGCDGLVEELSDIIKRIIDEYMDELALL